MRGIIYARVSTDEQLKSGVSLSYQKDRNLEFCKNNGIEVNNDHIFLETYSGAFFDRIQLGKIFDLIKKDDFDCIIVLRRDRLARDVGVFNQIKKIFDTAGIKIFYPEEGLSGDEGINDFLGNTLVGFSQFEKTMIHKRTYSGRRKKSEEGKWTTQVPYGYIKTKEGFLEGYDPEIKIIKLIVDLYLNENKSINKIVDYLNENKILPPSMSEKQSATQKGILERRKNAVTFWSFSSVVRVLDNVSKYYTGEYKAFATEYKKVGKKSKIMGHRDESEIIKIKIPKFYTKTIAKKIEDKRKTNRNHASKGSTRTYLLKGKLFCDCQPDLRNFIGYTGGTKSKLRNYRCSMSDKRKTTRVCRNSISGGKIDTLVIDTLKDFFLDYNKFRIEYGLDSEATQDKGNIIDEYKGKIQNLEDKEKRALELTLDGLIDKNKLKEIKEEVKTGIEKFKDLIHEEYELVYNQYKQGLLDGDVKKYTDELYKYASDYFENSTYEGFKEIVDMMVDKVIIPTDKTKPIRIILNVYPGEFDFDKYLDEDRKSCVVREYNKEKTLLSNYQIEFSKHLESEDYTPTDGGDYKFIKLLKKKFKVLFINGKGYNNGTKFYFTYTFL